MRCDDDDASTACPAESLIVECKQAPSPLKLPIEQLISPQKHRPHSNKLIRALTVEYSTFDMPEDKMSRLKNELEAVVPGYPKEEDHRLARLINRSHLFGPLYRDAAAGLVVLFDNREVGGSFQIKNLGLIFSALKHRNTSRKEDEMYCIANLMKLPVLPILAVEPEQRMKKLLTLMPQAPATVIFSHQFTRIEDEGFSWAPKTFMNMHALNCDSSSLGRVKTGGLHVSFPGLKVQSRPADHGNGIADAPDQLEKPQIHRIKVAMPLKRERWLYALTMIHPPSHPPTTWRDYEEMDLMVIVRSTFSDEHGRIADTVDAALVSLITQDDHIRTVKFLTVIWMRRSHVELTEESTRSCYSGEWLDDESLWYIV
jgi:hypothetical protein